MIRFVNGLYFGLSEVDALIPILSLVFVFGSLPYYKEEEAVIVLLSVLIAQALAHGCLGLPTVETFPRLTCHGSSNKPIIRIIWDSECTLGSMNT